MAVPMDSSLAPSSWERAERLYKKNIELENGLRKSAQMKVPSDPNIWFQMRENYEAIVLEDHDFSEKHEIEYVLWQLHYRRIEEFRARINAAPPAGSIASQGGKSSANMERIKRIRSAFKSFLSEATGFYHDLILKIRSNYGLPLGYFSEESDNQILPMKDEKKMAEMKKGLISCHRCLIYLGDLARYKGLYGEGDSVKREYAAASSYYKQAASLCPSSGNTHHQLAILASYFGDDLLAVYRYFRSLAVDIPFSTARDNLIIAFEKNRQNYSQLPSNTKAPAARILPTRSAGRGRGRDAKVLAKELKTDATPVKEREPTIPEIFKAFSTRFVRLNGILFTRTSLETFGEIFSSVISDLHDLVSSGPEEGLNFSSDAAENALIIVRLIAILIFTVHNVKRESEGLSYAEILQRTLLLKNAFTAAFEFVGHILKRCIELHDIASSTYLPAILVYIEWLACHPDIAAGSDIEENQSKARSFFWNQCISFLNKLILTGLASVDGDDDDNCFSDMSMYDEGETGNRLALWEDFELRGFLPLVPAQVILDFSKKHAFESGSIKEKSTRVQRILAAGRALMNVVQIDQQRIYFDPYSKKFVMSIEPPEFEATLTGITDIPETNGNKQGCQLDDRMNLEAKLSAAAIQSKAQLYVEGEEDEEVIVFKPTVAEKFPSVTTSVSPTNEYTRPVQASAANWATNGTSFTTPLDNGHLPNILNVGADLQTVVPQLPPHYASPETSKWLLERQAFLSDGLKNLNFGDNGLLEQGLQRGLNGLQPQSFAPQISAAVNSSNTSMLYNQIKAAEIATSSVLHYVVPSGAVSDATSIKFTAALPAASKKNPVSRPVRHIGPPPGFSHVPSKQQDDPISSLTTKDQHPQVDDYSWLDGYQPPSTKAVGMDNYKNNIGYMYPNVTAVRNNAVNATTGFPFPGKQVSGVQTHVVNENKWQDFQLFEQLKPYAEQQLQQAHQQNGLLPEQQPAQSLWSDRYFV
ncbi:nonsense-mediated mRNA decay factor SMG7-like [Typha latifolia]|uniref:nonsense-mediated mRNA decay factor SMG7-like n=1 Tax=Typha latifolia TaxID=4733 RepID=UPI003C2D2D5B